MSPNPYKISRWNFQDYHMLYIATTWQFLSNSEMGHVLACITWHGMTQILQIVLLDYILESCSQTNLFSSQGLWSNLKNLIVHTLNKNLHIKILKATICFFLVKIKVEKNLERRATIWKPWQNFWIFFIFCNY